MPTLSHELRQSGEGAISLEECTEVLNSFPLNKVPGNDGLPVEFYKTFWVSIERGELSTSQKQAVITLIEKKKDLDRCDLKNWRPISL